MNNCQRRLTHMPLFCCLLMVMLFTQVHGQTPTPELQAREDIQQQINHAIASNQKQLVIKPGVYRLAVPTRSTFLTIANAKDLTIIADGVTFILTSLNRAIQIENCENLTLQGLTIDYDPLPFTQGLITNISEDRRYFDVQLCDGYPPIDLDFKLVCSVIDPASRIIKANTWSRYGGSFEKLGDRHYRIDQKRPMIDAMAVGDYALINRRDFIPHTIFLTESSNCTLRNVTLLTSSCFGFFESSCSGNRYDGLVIKPGPTPQGATVERFMSSRADGFHSKHAKVGPVVENCRFERMGDDGIAINGDFLLVMGRNTDVDKPSMDIIVKRQELYVQPGDRVLGLSRETGVPLGESRVVGIEKLDVTEDQINQTHEQAHLKLHRKDVYVSNAYRLILDKPISVSSGDLVSCPDRNGSGFVVRNNHIGLNRARGILIKASDGVIENNKVDRSFASGIVLAPELTGWMEADFSRDVTIKGNHVIHANRMIANPGYFFAGAISVCANRPMPAGGQRNIVIADNIIEKTTGPAIQVVSGYDVAIAGNKVITPNVAAGGNGSRFGVPEDAVFWVSQSQKVMLKDNTVQTPGAYMKRLLVADESAEVFATNGVVVVPQIEK